MVYSVALASASIQQVVRVRPEWESQAQQSSVYLCACANGSCTRFYGHSNVKYKLAFVNKHKWFQYQCWMPFLVSNKTALNFGCGSWICYCNDTLCDYSLNISSIFMFGVSDYWLLYRQIVSTAKIIDPLKHYCSWLKNKKKEEEKSEWICFGALWK